MTKKYLSHWQQWVEKPHVKSTWFIAGYEPTDYIHQIIEGNGYDYPFIIFIEEKPVGYIVCCDLYAYRTLCKNKKGLFTEEEQGTFCFDLFIGDENYLHQGYGTQIVKQFAAKIFAEFDANIIYIDPSVTNKPAIRCYEKAGFQFIKKVNDGVCDCYLMAMYKSNNKNS